MRNVIFPTFPHGGGDASNFSTAGSARNEGDCPRMNRRNDRAVIPLQGTRNFRNKETAGPGRRRNLHTKCIYVYGMYAVVNASRENSGCFEPFDNRDLQQFSAESRHA